ncbi:MAG: hypothetical protein ACK40L_01200, partial [Hydrogenophaga sp.]
MLYQIYETQRSIMEPFADLAEVAAKLYSNPLLPIAQWPGSQRISAAYDLMHRLGKDYEKPEFGIRTVDVDGVDVAIHERVEINKPFCELRRFKRFTDDANTLTQLKGQPVVLVVAPLSDSAYLHALSRALDDSMHLEARILCAVAPADGAEGPAAL